MRLPTPGADDVVHTPEASATLAEGSLTGLGNLTRPLYALASGATPDEKPDA